MAAALITAGLAVSLGASAAQAGTGNQWCNTGGICFNAWNGGPYVKSYYYGQPQSNNDFTWVVNTNSCNGGRTTSTCPGHGVPAGQGIGGIKFTGNTGWAGRCIGDASNDPNLANSSLDTCPGGSNGNGGYGTNFAYVTSNSCGAGWVILYNFHWDGWINIPNTPAQTIYLNNQQASCVHLLAAG